MEEIIIDDLNESTTTIKNITEEVFNIVSPLLRAYLPNYKFMPSVRMGLFDGIKKFYKIVGRDLQFPKGLTPYVLNKLQKLNYNLHYNSIQHNDILPTEDEFREFVNGLGLPFQPYDYQFKASYESLLSYRQINVMCTSSGKSLTIYLILRWFLAHNMKTVLLVPRISLVEQMYSDFISYGWKDIDEYTKKIGGDNKVETLDSDLIISTWQSFQDVSKNYKKRVYTLTQQYEGDELDGGNIIKASTFINRRCNRVDYDDGSFEIIGINQKPSKNIEYSMSEIKGYYSNIIEKNGNIFNDVDALIIDEVHTASSSGTGGNIYENVIFPASTGSRYRLGFTGTLKKDLVFKMSLLGTIGASKTYVKPRQLIDMGLATPVQIKALFLNYPMTEKSGVLKLTYQQEVDYIATHTKRNNIIANVANKLASNGDNTIVLFDRVEHGERMALQAVKNKFGIDVKPDTLRKLDNPYKIYLVTGKTKASIREDLRQLMEREDGITLYGTSSILSTGVNIKNLRHLILASGGKSSVTINQSIGRLLRKHVSKDMTTIWDIVDDFTVKKRTQTSKNHFYKHFEHRLEIYSENEYDIIEKEITV